MEFVCAAVSHRFARSNGMDKVEFVILDLTPVPHIDSMGCHFLEELNEVSLCRERERERRCRGARQC
jgi:anti-anti-sigma regulatory factor